jgi:hypothetical protein
MLDNVFLQDVIGHAERLALWIEVFLFQVVTIVTAQVADGTNRFGKNLKFAGSFGHCPITHLRVERHKAVDLIRTRFFWEEYRGINVVGQGKRSYFLFQTLCF